MIERSEIRFGATCIPFVIRRSDRRHTVALAIDGGTLVVTAPTRATVERLNELVRGKALWVKHSLRDAGTLTAPPAREFVSGETFRYLGRQHRLRVEPQGARAEVKLERGWLVVAGLGQVAGSARGLHEPAPAQVRAALVRWYRQRAEERLPEQVAAWCARLGLPPPRVLIREQQRRWGSCTRTGELRLNWRILQAPSALVDYVIAHELTHLLRHDDGHSPAFWAQLGRTLPDYEARRTHLRDLGPSLQW